MGSWRNGFRGERFILSVDVGTTSIRCHVYDKEAKIRGSCSEKVVPLFPEEGHVEIDPHALWKSFISVVRGAVTDAGIQMQQVEALGMSTQRATFTTWNRKTGVPFHSFISWQDQRAADLVKSWNASCTMKVIHGLMKMVYFLTQQKRYLAASLIVFSPQHVTMRLLWVLQHYTQVRQACEEGTCCFGTIDTWLLFKLTKGRVHATDYSNASSTGIFDSYQMCWSGFLCSLVSLPLSILPTVQDTRWRTSRRPCLESAASTSGMSRSPWERGPSWTSTQATSPIPQWQVCTLLWAGRLAPRWCTWRRGTRQTQAPPSDGRRSWSSSQMSARPAPWRTVCPTQTGCALSRLSAACSSEALCAPLNDPKACASLMGLKPTSTKSHLIRAILESVAFRNKQLYETVLRETDIPITNIRVDGGVSSNDFVLQLTADLCGRKLVRLQHREMSCLGAALVAGLGTGFWRTREELRKLQSTDEVFLPRGGAAGGPCEEYAPILRRWERALRRSMNWYKP